MELNERIRQVRKERKETQTEIAEFLKIKQQQYFKYEKGINEIPNHYVAELCRHWNVSADYLLGLTDTPWTLDQR